MKIYKDKELTQEIEDNTFDLDIVEAGDTKKFTFYMLNDSNAFLRNLEFSLEQFKIDENDKLVPCSENELEHLEIINAPTELFAKTNSELIIEWEASITIKRKLIAKLTIKGQELYR